jgi:hypothetical protein
MVKTVIRMLIFIIFSFFVIKVLNSTMRYIYYESILINTVLEKSIFVIWLALVFAEWFFIGNVINYNMLTKMKSRFKYICHILFFISIGILIIIVNNVGDYLGFNPIYEKHKLFSTFIGLENDWFGPIKLLAINILGDDFTVLIYSVLSILIMCLFIIIGTFVGIRTKQIVKKDFVKL